MLFKLTIIYAIFMFSKPVEEPKIEPVSIIEEYFERGNSLSGLQYAKWGIFLNGNKKIDCSWLPLAFWIKKWFRTVDKRWHTNSYKLFLMWKKRETYFDIRRWDTIFFLPFTWSAYHIGFAWTWVTNNKLPFFDFYSKRHLWVMSVRDLHLYRCWRSYCMWDGKWNIRRILNRTNIFEEVLESNLK